MAGHSPRGGRLDSPVSLYLHALLARDAHAHVCHLDHADVIGSVPWKESGGKRRWRGGASRGPRWAGPGRGEAGSAPGPAGRGRRDRPPQPVPAAPWHPVALRGCRRHPSSRHRRSAPPARTEPLRGDPGGGWSARLPTRSLAPQAQATAPGTFEERRADSHGHPVGVSLPGSGQRTRALERRVSNTRLRRRGSPSRGAVSLLSVACCSLFWPKLADVAEPLDPQLGGHAHLHGLPQPPLRMDVAGHSVACESSRDPGRGHRGRDCPWEMSSRPVPAAKALPPLSQTRTTHQ